MLTQLKKKKKTKNVYLHKDKGLQRKTMINSITINDRGLSSKRKNAVCVREMGAERLAIVSNSGSRTLTPSSGFCRHCTHMVHIHIYKQSTYTDKNKKYMENSGT